jgi:dTDP-4-amino-4,6-dideoxygalactose transaminase
MFVGGEFFSDTRWVTDHPMISTQGMHFLNGGRACLMLICDYLLDHGIDQILLPSYLCPSILQILERQGLMYDFYPVKEDLSIDLQSLTRKAENYRAIYLLNYFGFKHDPETLDFLKRLQRNGILVVEDNAQTGFSDDMMGDFVFNSMRKLSAFDGGYLITQKDINPYFAKYLGRPNRRLAMIRDYRQRLLDYLVNGQGDHGELERLFYLAETAYETDEVVFGNIEERKAIEHLDWPGIKLKRRDNFEYLLGLISDIPEIVPIFPTLQADNMPLGLPIFVTGISRDLLNDTLSDAGIGLTIHWEEILSYPGMQSNLLALDMAKRMLTLTIDQRFGHKHMDYLAANLSRAIKTIKITG